MTSTQTHRSTTQITVNRSDLETALTLARMASAAVDEGLLDLTEEQAREGVLDEVTRRYALGHLTHDMDEPRQVAPDDIVPAVLPADHPLALGTVGGCTLFNVRRRATRRAPARQVTALHWTSEATPWQIAAWAGGDAYANVSETYTRVVLLNSDAGELRLPCAAHRYLPPGGSKNPCSIANMGDVLTLETTRGLRGEVERVVAGWPLEHFVAHHSGYLIDKVDSRR